MTVFKSSHRSLFLLTETPYLHNGELSFYCSAFRLDEKQLMPSSQLYSRHFTAAQSFIHNLAK